MPFINTDIPHTMPVPSPIQKKHSRPTSPPSFFKTQYKPPHKHKPTQHSNTNNF